MKYYPVFLDVTARPCLVVGGGRVGFRKAGTLEKCGARVTVVSEQFGPDWQKAGDGMVRLKEKAYDSTDVEGMFLVFAATDNGPLNSRIKADAAALNILCSIADDPDKSDFILPAVAAQQDLIIAVSTCGASPALARAVKEELSEQYGPAYGRLLSLLRAVRQKLLAGGHAPDTHREQFQAALGMGLLQAVESGDTSAVDAILRGVFGKGYEYGCLIPERGRDGHPDD